METKPSKFDFFTREGVRLNAGGLVDRAARFPVAAQYLDRTLWKRCVDQFDGRTDFCSDVHDEGWRGEYWGKMMRGAALTYDYTLDEELYDVLAQTVDDLLTRAADARLSSYPPGRDLRGWDVWGRKYVMLGLITFRGICDDEALVSRIDAALCRMADALIERVGAGKTEIYDTSDLWNGINSSSILEPFVLLYEITGAEKYLDFARYIIGSGMMKGGDLVALIDSGTPPYEYPAHKAYELISCVEGLLEFGLATRDKTFVDRAVKFADAILDTDFTVVGAVGCEGEQLNHAALTQCDDTDDIKQETCVTVTFMKLLARLFAVTGDGKYVDAFERAAFNALYGAVNFEGNCANGGLPFDSYSPLIEETRAKAIGGLKILDWVAINGCCAAIGGAGTALVPRMLVTRNENGLYFNIYSDCVGETDTDRGPVAFAVKTGYPFGSSVCIAFTAEPDVYIDVYLRIPDFAGYDAVIRRGEETIAVVRPGKYLRMRRVMNGEILEIDLDLRHRFTPGTDGKRFAVSYGPVVYAADSRYADPAASYDDSEDEFSLCDSHEMARDAAETQEDDGLLEQWARSVSGDAGTPLVPYYLAGDDWKSAVTVWLKKR